MNKSQTIDMINRYYSIIENEDTSDEAREFINQFSLNFIHDNDERIRQRFN